MYYSITCTNLTPAQKQEFAGELHEQLGLPVSTTHIGGSEPFIQIDRFGNDVTISRMTRLPDPEAVASKMEDVAEKFFAQLN